MEAAIFITYAANVTHKHSFVVSFQDTKITKFIFIFINKKMKIFKKELIFIEADVSVQLHICVTVHFSVSQFRENFRTGLLLSNFRQIRKQMHHKSIQKK